MDLYVQNVETQIVAEERVIIPKDVHGVKRKNLPPQIPFFTVAKFQSTLLLKWPT
jgi:hypothetical protein